MLINFNTNRINVELYINGIFVSENDQGRDNNAEGIVFRKRFNKQETFSGGERTSKSILKTYLGNLEKNIFRSKIYDFVVIFS